MANPGGIIMINGGTCDVYPSAKKLYCAGLKEQGGGGPTGGHVYTYSLANGSTYLATDITGTLTNCTGLYDVSNPGFKWDSASSKFVKYSGTGNSVTVFDPVALSCTTQTYSNGPSNPVADTYGIYDLFAYFPSLGAFAVLPNATDQVFKLIIDGVAPTITTPASAGAITGGTQNTFYTYTFAASGTTPMTWDIPTGTPPTGVSINQSTGVLSGTPTASGDFSFTIRATNGYGSPSAYAVTLHIAPVCLITAATLPAGKFNVPYSQTVTTAGCTSPAFAVTSGTLPPGLNLDNGTGAITGTPTVSGLFSFTITATPISGAGIPSQAYGVIIIPGPGVLNFVMPPGFISR